MVYDFDTPIVRRGTNSYKWDSTTDEQMLPLWVADMDFKTAPAITEALARRVQHGVFGYTRVPDAYYQAVTEWFARKHNFCIQKEWIIYTSGVVPAISAIIKSLTSEGDKVLVQTPVYNCFFSSIRNNGCEVVSSPLVRKGDSYVMDFDDLERKVADPKVKVMLLCNPHNPSGRVWTRDELQQLGNICLRNDVKVIADEIHCELVSPHYQYTPFASLSDELAQNSITCVSPSKAFNIAGLQIANIIAPHATIRQGIDRAININEVCDVNPFGVIATIVAYNEGEEWLKQLNDYIWHNYLYLQQFVAEHLPDYAVCRLEGTYLAWMDCRKLAMPTEQLEEYLKHEAHIWLNAGTMYGAEGEGYMRWNLACTRSTLTKALARFSQFVECHS